MADPSSHLGEHGPENSGQPPRVQPCRVCGKPVKSTDDTSPFCSDRCRLVDLGKWFNESHKVSRPLDADEHFD